MELGISEHREIELKKVYNPISLKADKEQISICMRDGGFEFYYQGTSYSINDGEVKRIERELSAEEYIPVKPPKE